MSSLALLYPIGKNMDGIKQQAMQQKQEAMYSRQAFQMRKENRQMRAELDKLKESNDATITRLQKEFDKNAFREQEEYESKLQALRAKNEKLLAKEKERYQRMREENTLS